MSPNFEMRRPEKRGQSRLSPHSVEITQVSWENIPTIVFEKLRTDDASFTYSTPNRNYSSVAVFHIILSDFHNNENSVAHHAIEMKMSFITHEQNEVVILLENCSHLMCEVQSLCVIPELQLFHNGQFVGVEISGVCTVRVSLKIFCSLVYFVYERFNPTCYSVTKGNSLISMDI